MKRQRGVALLTAVLAVALAVVLVAALLDRGGEARARTAHALRAEQSWQLLRGLEAWAMRVLQDEEASLPGVDSRGDLWSQPLPPVEVPGGHVSGSLRELGGCFNLNSLWNGGGGDDPGTQMQERFARLLRVLRLDPNIAAAARDWIDPDGNPGHGGAEDLQYAVRSPPYRAANRPFAHVSELRLVRGVDAESFQRLRLHVCALPDPAVPMNLNTATPELWMSLDERISEAMARRLWREGQARYPDLDALRAELRRELQLPDDAPLPFFVLLGVYSDWFVMQAEITADELPFLYSSLIHRSDTGPRIHARIRGHW